MTAVAGLMLDLGCNDRKRGFAILAAIGAKRAQLGAFRWSEGVLVIVGGAVFGMLTGTNCCGICDVRGQSCGRFDEKVKQGGASWLARRV